MVMTLDTPHIDWEQAACAGYATELFFPEGPGQVPTLARQVCNGVEPDRLTPGTPPCPIRTECLLYALEHKEWGVWGGLSQQKRDTMRRKARGQRERRT